MRKRNYQAEYSRRIDSGNARGLSRSQARGHSKASESGLRSFSKPLEDDRLQFALRALRQEGSIVRAAKAAKISPERLRKIAIEKAAIQKDGRRWRTRPTLPREMQIVSRKRAFEATLPDFESASKVGRFNNALKQFIRTNRVAYLRPFEGEGVRDIMGKFHPFETDPNALHRLASSGQASFEQIYRIVI